MTATSEGDGDLAALREKVERLDTELVSLLARRVALARDVGAYKRDSGLATLDAKREAAVLRRIGTLARDAGLPQEPVRQLFWTIIGICRHAQEDSR
jgi:chorismate mutase/prephenate dehydratase